MKKKSVYKKSIYKKRKVLVLVLLLCLVASFSRNATARDTIFNSTYTATAQFSNLYLGFHSNHFYFRIYDNYIYLPGVNTPLWLLWAMTQKTLQNMAAKLLFYPVQDHLQAQEAVRRMLKKPICRPRSIIWEPGELNLSGLLSIQTSCINDEPVWKFNAAPPRSRDEFNLFSNRSRTLGDEAVFFAVWGLMNRINLDYLALIPGQKDGRNTLSINFCTVNQDCHTIELNARLGSSNERQWLLHQLVYDLPPSKKTISALNNKLIVHALESIHCLRSINDSPKFGGAYVCNADESMTIRPGQQPGHWSYDPGPQSQTYPFQNWLFKGKGQRLLPLNRCDQSKQQNHYRCGSFLFWADEYRSEFLPPEHPEPVLKIGFDQHYRDYYREFFVYDSTLTGAYFRTTNYAESIFNHFFLIPYLSKPDVGSGDYGTNTGEPVAKANALSENWSFLNTVKIPWTPLITVSKGIPSDGIIQTPGQKGANPPSSQGKNVVSQPGAQANPSCWGVPPWNQKNKKQDDDDQQPPEPPPNRIPPYLSPLVPHDLNGLLGFLQQQYGRVASGLPASPALAKALNQGTMPEVAVISSLFNGLQLQPKLYRHAKIPGNPKTILNQIFAPHGLRSGLPEQLVVLSELLFKDVVLFEALAPGQHVYHRYSRTREEVYQGLVLSAEPQQFGDADLFLVHSPEGYIQLFPQMVLQPFLFPVSVTYQAIPQIFYPPPIFSQAVLIPVVPVEWETTGPALFPVGPQGFINAFGAWTYEQAEVSLHELVSKVVYGVDDLSVHKFLDSVTHSLALQGHVGFPVPQSREQDIFLSKTALEWVESYWTENHAMLFSPQGIFSNAAFMDEIQKSIHYSRTQRFDRSRGYIESGIFHRVFIDAGLPMIKTIAEEQQKLLALVANVLGELTRDSSKLAVYGGLASRVHLLDQVFGSDRDEAVRQGIRPVNDIDIMAMDHAALMEFQRAFLQRLAAEFPWINRQGPDRVENMPPHLYSEKIILRWNNIRLFTIDISFSAQPEYFDFNDIEYHPVPLMDKLSHQMPVISFRGFVNKLVQEYRDTGTGPDALHRQLKAARSLWMLKHHFQLISSLEKILGEDWIQKTEDFLFGKENISSHSSVASDDASVHSNPAENNEQNFQPTVTPDPVVEKKPSVVVEELTAHALAARVSAAYTPVPKNDPQSPVSSEPGSIVSDKESEKTPSLVAILQSLSLNLETEPLHHNPFAKAISRLNKLSPISYVVRPPLSQEKIKAASSELETILARINARPEETPEPIGLPSSLGDYFSGVEPEAWQMNWLNEYSDLELDDNWFLQSMTADIQGRFWLWYSFHSAELQTIGERIQFPKQLGEKKSVMYLRFAKKMGNPVAGYLLAVLNLHKTGKIAAFYQPMLRYAGLHLEPARYLSVEQMINPDIDTFDPLGAINLIHQGKSVLQHGFLHDLETMPSISRQTAAVIKAITLLPQQNPTQAQQEEAATWLMAAINDDNGQYHSGIIAVLIASGLSDWLPWDWKKICASASPSVNWVCSWQQAAKETEDFKGPAWVARQLSRLKSFKGKSALSVWKKVLKMPPDELLQVTYSDGLMFNTQQWINIIHELRQAVGGKDTHISLMLEAMAGFAPDKVAEYLVSQSKLKLTGNNRILVARISQWLKQQMQAGNKQYSDVRRQLWRITRNFPEAWFWLEDSNDELIKSPQQAGFDFDSPIITDEEADIQYINLPYHPVQHRTGEKFVYRILVHSGAKISRDGEQMIVRVNPDNLKSKGMASHLKRAVSLGNPEARWLQFLSARREAEGVPTRSLKLAARELPYVRKAALPYLLSSESHAFDPYSIFPIYREGIKYSETLRVLVAPDINPGEHLLLDQYLTAWTQAQNDADREQAWSIISGSPALSSAVYLNKPEVMALIMTGQYQKLPGKQKKAIMEELNNGSSLSRFVSLFLPETPKTKALANIRELNGDRLDPTQLRAGSTKKGKRKVASSLAFASLARRLVIDKKSWQEFSRTASAIYRRQDASLEHRQRLLSDLWRIMSSDQFLFNRPLTLELVKAIDQVDEQLAKSIRGSIPTWDQDYYSDYMLREVVWLTRMWKTDPVRALMNQFDREYLKLLVSGIYIDGIPESVRNVYRKTLSYVKSVPDKQTQQVIAAFESIHQHSPKDDATDWHNLEQLTYTHIKYSPQWWLAQKMMVHFVGARLMELVRAGGEFQEEALRLSQQLSAYRHPFGQFIRAWLYYREHGELSAEICHYYLYPSASSFLPSLQLLIASFKDRELSLLELERIRKLREENSRFESLRLHYTEPDFQSWLSFSQELIADETSSSKLKLLTEIISEPMTVFQNHPEYLENSVEAAQWITVAFLQHYSRYLKAYSDGVMQQVDALQSITGAFLDQYAQQLPPFRTRELQGLLGHKHIHMDDLTSRSQDNESNLLLLVNQLFWTEKSDKFEAMASTLISMMDVHFDNAKGLGQALAWLPWVHQNYGLLMKLASELTGMKRYDMALQLYETMMGWAIQKYSDSFLEAHIAYMEFLLIHFPDLTLRQHGVIAFFSNKVGQISFSDTREKFYLTKMIDTIRQHAKEPVLGQLMQTLNYQTMRGGNE